MAYWKLFSAVVSLPGRTVVPCDTQAHDRHDMETPMTRLASAAPLLFSVALVLATAGCKDKEGDSSVACDESAVASVQVIVTDSSAGPIDGATVSWSAGGESGDCESVEGTTLVCGWDVTGEMTLTATAAGYVDQTQTVNVESDGCHAITENATFRLDPA